MSTAPSSSPWGQIQDCERLSEGVWTVSTASHGGIKLDRIRNALIPEAARIPGGWYEEDCDYAIPVVALGLDSETRRDAARQSIRRWQSPEIVRAVLGEDADPEVNLKLQDMAFRVASEGRMVVVSALTSKASPGMVIAYAVRGGRTPSGAYASEERGYFLVTAERYAARNATGGHIIDEALDLPTEERFH